MEQQEIIDGNILIAEFMGGALKYVEESVTVRGDTHINKNTEVHGLRMPYTSRMLHTSQLKFHSSWDWIMPVIEYIEEMGIEVQIHSHIFYTNKRNDKYVCDFHRGSDVSKIEMCFMAIVKFIKEEINLCKPS